MGMTKRKIFKMELPETGYDSLRSGMLSNRYNSNNTTGFILDYSNSFETKGAYIVSEKITETIEIPNGNEITIERPQVSITKFRVVYSMPQFVELINPPRAIRPFISQLELLTNFSITLQSPTLDIRRFAEESAKLIGQLTSYKIAIQSISLSEQTIATATVRSSKDAIREAQLVFGDRKFKINKASFNNQNGTMEVGANGSLSISDGSFSESIDDLIKLAIK